MPKDPSRPMSAARLAPPARVSADETLGNRALHWWILAIVAALLWILLS